MQKAPGVLTAGLGTVVALTALSGCTSDDRPVVETGAVGRHTVVERVEAPASVVAAAAAVVESPATGTISRVAVGDGERVDRGDLLFVVDSPQTEQQLTLARQAAAATPAPVHLPQVSTGATAQQAATAAARAFARARATARQIGDPDLRRRALQQITTAEAQLQVAQAQTQAAVDQINGSVTALQQSLTAFTQAQTAQAQAAVRAAERAVTDLMVRAPIGGRVVLGASPSSGGDDLSSVVGELPSEVAGPAASLLDGDSVTGGSSGGIVTAGSPVTGGDPILTVTDTSELTLSADIDETDVLLVHRGVVADVEFDAVPGARYRAVVLNVDLAPTTSSRGGVSYVARLSLGGGTRVDGTPAPRPRPGMSAVASLRVLRSEDVVAIPVAAVFRDGERDAVWVVDGDSPTERVVTLGAQGEDYLEVLDGVEEDETIVVSGADQVSEGESLP